MVKSPRLNRVEAVYTDGACSGNPGPGGWGTVIYLEGDRRHELGGADPSTTNNRMEIQAAIAALEALLVLNPEDVPTVYTDSQYVQNGITKWIHGWKKNGWKTANGKAVLNQDLWEQLDRLHQQVNAQRTKSLRWTYVRGHSGNVGNERCDVIAREFAAGRQPELVQVPGLLSQPSPPVNGDTSTAPSATSAASVSQNSASPNPSDAGRSQNGAANIEGILARLHAADELSERGYLVTSAELATLTDLPQKAIEHLGPTWCWRNWEISQCQRRGDPPQPNENQLFWQLSRIN